MHHNLTFLINMWDHRWVVKTRLPAALVDLLLDCISLLIRDDSPGVVVTTVQDLGKVLSGEGPREGERCQSVAPDFPTDAARRMFEIMQHYPVDYQITRITSAGQRL